jgi:hypothetical protein
MNQSCQIETNNILGKNYRNMYLRPTRSVCSQTLTILTAKKKKCKYPLFRILLSHFQMDFWLSLTFFPYQTETAMQYKCHELSYVYLKICMHALP